MGIFLPSTFKSIICSFPVDISSLEESVLLHKQFGIYQMYTYEDGLNAYDDFSTRTLGVTWIQS